VKAQLRNRAFKEYKIQQLKYFHCPFINPIYVTTGYVTQQLPVVSVLVRKALIANDSCFLAKNP